jgi:hypothetical protein
MSGCDKSLLVPSNTPAPTPEPSKSALPASDGADTGSSVRKYAVNSVVCVAALAVIVGCYDVFRYFKPEKVIIPAPNPVKSVNLTFDEFNEGGYQRCHSPFGKPSISYTWYLAKREIERNYWANLFTREKLDSKIPVYKWVESNVYIYKPIPGS